MKKKILISIFTIVIIYFSGFFIINNENFYFIKKFIPIYVKNFIKVNLYYYQNKIVILKEENQLLINRNNKLAKDIDKLNKLISSSSLLLDQKNIKSKNNYLSISLKKFYLPFKGYYENKGKPVAYIEQLNNDIIIVSGVGDVLYFKANDIQSNKLKFNPIKSNLYENILDEEFKIKTRIGIRDILIHNNYVYLSYNKKVKENCYNTSIVRALINFEKLNFENFFTYKDCVDENLIQEFNAQQSGGRMVIDNKNLILSIGEYRNRNLAQQKNSLFGKLISINLSNKEFSIISIGHRNPQGLIKIENTDLLLSSEHGPRGGDEINLIKINQKIGNYGWPIASYGEHYDGKKRENSPLYKSHKNYNFEEPIIFFTPSIGISEIVNIPNGILKLNNNYFFSSLKAKKIYYFSFEDNFQKTLLEDELLIDERIRDIMYIKKINSYILILENTPSIALLQIK